MSNLVDHTVNLPTDKIPPETDAIAIASSFVPRLASIGPELFDVNGIWRDVYALTGTLRTFYGPSSISAAWNDTSKVVQPGCFSIDSKGCRVVDNGGHASWLQATFTFETFGSPNLKCTAILALVRDTNAEWRIWTLRTIMDQLKGQADIDVLQPVSSVTGVINDLVNGASNGVSRLINVSARPTQFDCVVIGGGQAGLSLGGRLKALGVNYVVLDKHNEVGDSWKMR